MYHDIAETEIQRLTARASEAGIPMSHVLAEAGLAKNTWYRGRKAGRALPRISTLQRVDRAITTLIEKRAADAAGDGGRSPAAHGDTTDGQSETRQPKARTRRQPA